MLSVISFKSFDDMLSYPVLDLGFSWHVSLAISAGLVYWNKKEIGTGCIEIRIEGGFIWSVDWACQIRPYIIKVFVKFVRDILGSRNVFIFA